MARLGDVATYVNGFAFKPEDWSSEGLPIIRIQDLTGNSYQANRYDGRCDAKYEVNPGDILISWSASLGVYVWQNEKALLNQHIFKVIFNKVEVDKSFFVHQVRNILDNAGTQAHGATMKHLTKPVFDALPFYLPDLPTQRRIAATLDKVSEGIALCKQMLADLDELVKSQFIEMFGDKQSGFKYPCSKVQELTDVCSGGTPDRNNAEYWEDGTVPWVKTTELQNNVINTVDEHITEKGLADSSAKLVPAGTILIAMYGQGKTRGMTAYLGIEASTNQACACILPTEKIDMVFMWQYFVNSYNELRHLAKGSNQANLNAGMIKNFPVPVPPIELQEQYSAFVKQIDKSKFAVQQQLMELETLKESLMQEYFG